MSKQKKGESSFWLSTIIAFLLAIFLTMASYLGGTYFGLFNKTLILDSMNKTSYYNSIITYTQEKAESLAIPIGIPAEVFNDVFTLDETYAEGNALIKAKLNGANYTPDTTNVKQRIVANINTYLTTQNLSVTSEQKANITTFAQTVADEYSNNLSIPYLQYYVQLRNMVSKLVMIGLPVFLLLSLFAIVLLIKLHTWMHRALRYIAYSTLAASLMTAVLPIYILAKGVYRRINISPEYFYNFVMSYITQSIFTFLYISLLLLAISAAIIVVIYFRRRELTKKRPHHHHSPHIEEA